MSLTDHARTTIEGLLADNRLVLFMKGAPATPQCGFSATAVSALNSLDMPYATCNVLEDPEVREGIKVFGQWPTIPQLYVDGELVGGSDIITEMFNSGELHALVGATPPDRSAPEITITDKAVAAIAEGMAGEEMPLHLKVDEQWQAQFMLAAAGGHEIVAESNGLQLYMDLNTANRARGMTIDFAETPQGSGLTIDLPMAPPPVAEMSPEELRERLSRGEIRLFDVRADSDRAQGMLPGAVALDREAMQAFGEIGTDEPIAFVCAHGNSSRATAEHFRKEGYRNLYNVTGGMAACGPVDSD